MTANTLYSNFIDSADDNGNIKNSKNQLDYIAELCGGIIRYDLYNELSIGGLWCIAGDTFNSQKVNLINPGTFDLSIVGDAEHVSCTSQGISGYMLSSGNGTTYSTNLIPSEVFASGGNMSISAHVVQDSAQLNNMIGCIAIDRASSIILMSRQNNNRQTVLTGSSGSAVQYVYPVLADSKGYHISSISGNVIESKFNGLKIVETDILGQGSSLPDVAVFVAGRNDYNNTTSGSTKRYGLFHLGLGLTESKLDKLSNLIRVSQGILNRQ